MGYAHAAIVHRVHAREDQHLVRLALFDGDVVARRAVPASSVLVGAVT